MAADATFPDRLMFKYEWSALRGVALETGLVMAKQRGAATGNILGQIRAATLYRIPLVWIMAIRAANFALQHRMVMRQLERCFHFRVALETGARRFSRIDNEDVASAPRLDVQTARAVTRLAPDVLPVCSFGFEPSVGRGAEIARNRFMARGALL